jgi:flavin-dependent dehydrogenase
VVGARVAGAATAMLLARCGHRVLVVDRARVGSDTVSTHTILRLGMMQLHRWGLAEKLIASDTPGISRVALGFGDEVVPIDLSDDFGVDRLYAPRRTVLDPILVQGAHDSGVESLIPSRMVEVLRRDGAVTGVVLDDGGERIEITARYVIGADGTWSRTAQLVGAAEYQSFSPRNATYYAYYTGIETDGIYFQFTKGATAGVIPTNGGESCVYVGWPDDRIGDFRRDPGGEFVRQAATAHPSLGAALRGGERVSRFRGTPGLPGFLKAPVGPGWALVGDAGYTKDSISAHGISDALRDAELCARAIDAALIEPESAGRHLAWYQRSRDRLSTGLLAAASRLGSYEWDESEASRLMREISRAVKEECEAMASLEPWAGIVPDMALVG